MSELNRDELMALKAERALNPATLGYTSDDVANALLIMTPSRTVRRRVPVARLKDYFRKTAHPVSRRPLRLTVEDLARDATAAPAHRDAARLALHTVEDPTNPDVDLDNPLVAAMLDLLIAGGAIEAAHKTAILAMGDTAVSRTEEIGIFKPVRARHFARAAGTS